MHQKQPDQTAMLLVCFEQTGERSTRVAQIRYRGPFDSRTARNHQTGSGSKSVQMETG